MRGLIHNITGKYIGNKSITLISMGIDSVLFVISFMIAYFIDSLTVGLRNYAGFGETMLLCIPCLIIVLSTLFFSRYYKIVWRYAGIVELLRTVLILAFTLLVNGVFRALFAIAADRFKYNVPLSLLLIAHFGFFAFAIAYRMMPKIYINAKRRLERNYLKNNDNSEKVLIFGAGYTGAATVKRLLENPQDGYRPVALIDDDPEKKGMIIGGLEVLGGREEIPNAIQKFDADTVIIAVATLTKKELRSIFDYIKKLNIKIMLANPMTNAQNIIDSDVISIRNIKIEDLLHRDEHTMDRELVDSFIKDKVIMVTGGAGSIGSELCRQMLYFDCKHLIIFDHSENGMFEFNEELKLKYNTDRYSLEMGSVRDKYKLHEVIGRYRPEVVFHAAAYKHVPMMELSADESVKNNVFGTRNVIEECNRSGVGKFILISTDKAINPANVMGASKRVAELALQNAAKTSVTQLAAVRFGNVLGSSGSVIPTFIRQINNGGPITVTDKEMKRYFMTIPEAVRLVLQAGALASGGEVFVLDMGEPVFIYDLACDLIRMSGLIPEKDVEIKITGLRPGEKLFEELQYGNEDVDKTKHKDIFVCKLSEIGEDVPDKIEELFQACMQGNKARTEKLLFELVPSEYRKKRKAEVS